AGRGQEGHGRALRRVRPRGAPRGEGDAGWRCLSARAGWWSAAEVAGVAAAAGRRRAGRGERLDQRDAVPEHPRTRGASAVSEPGRPFGQHVRSLRRARGMTQEVLAERSRLSADTIRRLEHGSFSPSLDTLKKLCTGLSLPLSRLFESFELG